VKNNIFLVMVFGFALGVLARSFFYLDYAVAGFLMALAVALILIALIFPDRRVILLISIFLATGGLGILRFHSHDLTLSHRTAVLSPQIGQTVTFEGLISEDPETRERNIKLVLQLENNVKVLITTEPYVEYKYGDRLRVVGKLTFPQNFTTETGKIFDYVNYLKKDGVLFEMRYPEIKITSREQGGKIKSALFKIKHSFSKNLSAVVPEPESALSEGLILGGKTALGEELEQKFIRTSTIHIVALSGFNVTIIGNWIRKIFSIFLPRAASIGLSALALVVFAILVGGGATVVRATIMGLLAMLARATGRTYLAARALMLAGLVMVLFNPLVLAFDISFQLSFLATLGIIFMVPIFERKFQKIPKFLGLREILCTTLAAQIAVLPLILYKMGIFSIVGLPANLAILLFIPLTMLFAFLAGATGWLVPILALPFAAATYFLAHYEIAVVKFFADWKYAALSVPNFPAIATLALYALIVWYLIKRYSNLATRSPS